MLKLIDVIIVNYRTINDTINCIESLFEQTLKPSNIIIVDNKSNDNSFDKFHNYFSFAHKKDNDSINFFYKESHNKVNLYKLNEINVYFISCSINRGYAYGNNVGALFLDIINSCSNLILISNPDIVYEKTSLKMLSKEYEYEHRNKSKVKIIGTQLNFFDNPSVVQAVGGSYNPFFGISKHIGAHELSENIDFKILSQQASYPIGACMLIDRDTYRTLKGFHERYFLYFEELDFIHRAKKINIDFKIVNSTLVLHKEGSSIGSSTKNFNSVSVFSDKYLLRSRLVFIKEFYPRYILPGLAVHFLYIFKRLLKGDLEKFKNGLLVTGVLFKNE